LSSSRRLLTTLALVSSIAGRSHSNGAAEAYPMILHIEDDQTACLRFNIRDHDDAHLIAVALPNEDQYPDKSANWHELETWHVQQLYEIGQKKSKKMGLATQLADAPEAVARKKSDFLQSRAHHQRDSSHHDVAPIQVKLSDNPSAESPLYKGKFQARYFQPLTVNHIKKFLKGNLKHRDEAGQHHHHDRDEGSLEGYGLCFTNLHPDHTTYVVFDVVLDSDEPTDPRLLASNSTTNLQHPATDFDKIKHLTPLERSLDQSIASAQAVLREMRYMEKREQRMRQTSDNINRRVRYFSYLSIGVLLVVTYIQIGYLKRYFHKKKLL
jgi:hypothetical protein